MKKHDRFGNRLTQAIIDSSHPELGDTKALQDMAGIIAGMIEGQADGPCRDFFNSLDIRFGRLNRPAERIEYLEEQRRRLQSSEAVSFFDAQLYLFENELDRRDKIAAAIKMNIEPTTELLSTWQDCGQKAAKFIQRIPYLKKMLEGLIEVENLELIEQELGLRKTQFTPEQVERLLEMQFSKEDISRMELLAYSFEDWVNERPGLFLESDCFQPLVYVDGGIKTWKVHTLSSLEFQKIQARRHEILEDFTNAYTNALIGYFESNLGKSFEKKILVENELERVERLLFDPNSKEIYSTYGETLWLSFRNDYPRGNEKFCSWYKLICIDGHDPLSYILPYHATITAKGLQDSDPAKFVVAALAFQRFKEFLKSRLSENNLNTALPKKVVKGELLGLDEIVKEPGMLAELWKHLSTKLDRPFVSERGVFIGNIEQNASPLMAIAYVLINRKLLKEKPKYSQTDIYKILCKYFDVSAASAPHRARDTNTYEDVKTETEKYFDRQQ